MVTSVENPFPTATKEIAGIRFIDESLLSGVSRSRQLFCSVDHRFIALSIVDLQERKFSAFEAFHFPQELSDEQLAQKISTLADQSNILKKIDFNRVAVQVANKNYTFIPSSLFRQEDVNEYYFLNHGQTDVVEIKADAVKAYDLVNVFSVSEIILSALKKTFERFSCNHSVSSLLDAIKVESFRIEQKNLSLHFHSSAMDVIVTEGRKLLFCNTFSYKTAEDALYYVLLICEQLSLNTERTPAVIYGELEKESAVAHLLQQYIRTISFGKRISTAQFTYGFDSIPNHFYYSAFSHSLIADTKV